MKKIIALTGIRSEYDILYPVLQKLKKNFNLRLIISGAHLSKVHGETYKMIVKDGFKILKKIKSLPKSDKYMQRPLAISKLIVQFTKIIEKENPDFILVVGDREEAIAAALVGNYMHKIVIHIGGGDNAFGNSDDPIRFAISKLAHLHCCTSASSYKNLKTIGEETFRIFNTGNPYFANIHNTPLITRNDLLDKLKINNQFKNYIVLIKHPLSSELKQINQQIKITLSALEKFCKKNNYALICISPNSDPGSKIINKILNKYKNKNWFYLEKSLPRNLFVNLMKHTKLLIGNSSMGILEAPYYKIPVINVGNRQKGRMNAGNVKFVKYNIKEIFSAINFSCFNKVYLQKIKKLKNPYGDKNSANKILKAINSVDLDNQKWYIKRNNFHE